MIDIFFKALGILGVVSISAGVLKGQTRQAALLYILGGCSLEAYSIYIGDSLLIAIQLLFIATSCIAFFKTKPKKTGSGKKRK